MRRETIRRRLAAGLLPRDRPAPGRFVRLSMRSGVSEGAVCSGCEAAIKPGEMMIDYTYPTGLVVCFHEECREIWEAERHRA